MPEHPLESGAQYQYNIQYNKCGAQAEKQRRPWGHVAQGGNRMKKLFTFDDIMVATKYGFISVSPKSAAHRTK